MKKKLTINRNEAGFASLVVAFIFILVMSLVTVGFAQLARREQQNALNKQLANQAYYAAESGINEIRAQLPAIETAEAASPGSILPSKCLGSPFVQNNGILKTENNVRYTCATVNLSPKVDIIQNNTVPGSSNFIFSTNGPIFGNTLTFAWGSADFNNSPNAPGGTPTQLPPLPSWHDLSNPNQGLPPVVQFSITPLDNLTRNGLISNTYTAVFYPSANTASVTTNYANPPPPPPDGYTGACTAYSPASFTCDDAATNAPIVSAKYTNTNTTFPFSVTINNLPPNSPPSGNNWWIVHFVNYYDKINACLEGSVFDNCSTSSTSTSTEFKNSEAIIDVTGKAKNVAKRIVDTVAISSSSSSGSSSTQQGADTLPAFAVDSGATCKRFQTYPATPGAGVNSPETHYFVGESPINNDCDLSNYP